MCCRCCQSCLEDIYWNCVEERFCYDESIANYNPDEDEYFTKKNGIITPIQQNDNNNMPICTQPVNRNGTISSKIHEEDYRREIQTSVPILAPEILSVFAKSQIFQDHPPKLPRNHTRNNLPLIHNSTTTSNANNNNNSNLLNVPTTTGINNNAFSISNSNSRITENDQEKLLKRLEGDLEVELARYDSSTVSTTNSQQTSSTERKFHFVISSESSPDLRRSLSPHQFDSIIEESEDTDSTINNDELILRPRRISESKAQTKSNQNDRKPLRNVQSVPYFSLRPASETDIFSISGSLSMTPEVPSISYSNLPKNYEDTPTLEKYKESISLYSIQAANQAKAAEKDYTMPRYFRHSSYIGKSAENISGTGSMLMATGESSSNLASLGSNGVNQSSGQFLSVKDDIHPPKRHEKSKRLKNLRGSLPPLLINAVRQHHLGHRKTAGDEGSLKK